MQVACTRRVLTQKKPREEADWLADDGAFRSMRDDDDERDFPQQAAEPPSLREHLNSQLSLSQIPERDRKIVGLLIDSLDDDGYLAQDLEELVDLLPPELEIDIDDLHIALEHLQHLDPPGVGARDLRECLVHAVACACRKIRLIGIRRCFWLPIILKVWHHGIFAQ